MKCSVFIVSKDSFIAMFSFFGGGGALGFCVFLLRSSPTILIGEQCWIRGMGLGTTAAPPFRKMGLGRWAKPLMG